MFKQNLVHLDLKGGAPKIDYLIKILPFLKSSGATGLLIEYEDTFTYSDTLEILRNKNDYYAENDLISLFKACAQNGLTIVPLIQTLGHFEFVLKHDSFRDLREVDEYPNVLCPSNERSLQLILEILNQIISFHKKYTNLDYIHLGADEVYFLARCTKCIEKCKENKWSRDDLFLDHVSKVAKFVKNIHSLKPIVWDDMFRHVSSVLIQKFDLNKDVQLMVWHYRDLENFLHQLQDESLWSKYLKLFDHIWIATAFKGASGVDAIMPPIEFHVNNHLAWDHVIKEYILNNPNYRQNISGIALTGWSRYDHMMTICELLPTSLPSLIMCLQVVQNMNSFTKEVQQKSSQLLGFNSLIPMGYIDPLSSISANYPGFNLFSLSIKLIGLINEKKALFRNPSVKGGFRQCLIDRSRINPLHIRSFLDYAIK